jgi:hypothetical protein
MRASLPADTDELRVSEGDNVPIRAAEVGSMAAAMRIRSRIAFIMVYAIAWSYLKEDCDRGGWVWVKG